MRVLHVIPSVARRYGGPSQAVVGFSRALNARGIDTVIATTNADGAGVLDVPLACETEFEQVRAIFFSRRGEGFKYSPALASWLGGHAARFDLVHIHAVFSHSSLAAARACRERRVPFIVRPLGSLDPWSLAQSAWKKRVLMQAAVNRMLRDAAALHFTTEEEARLAAPVSQSTRAVVIPPGIDESLLQTPVEPAAARAPVVLSLSRLDRKKNLEVLIAAFHRTAGRPPNAPWRLVIAGAGDADYRARLLEAAQSGPAADRISFPGWIDGDAKTTLLRRAALFALPSHQENFGIGLLEALACGTPAVMSSGVNLAAEAGRAGAGWVAGDAAEFERLLTAAMIDIAARARAGEAARAFAAAYGWARVGSALADLYESLTCAASQAS